MEMQRVPIYKAFHEACFIGNRWQMPSMQKYRVQTYSVSDTYYGRGKRYVVRADEKLTAFLELEAAINQSKILAKDQNSCY